ncbi:MAG: hypothetical protein LWX56_11665 [Ignavibacteria bacterium]|nr:hypothetical protein [Ignavibacteria bacterium]
MNTLQKLFSIAVLICIIALSSSSVFAQSSITWMSAGSLHNWYSNIGCEIEEGGPVKDQQCGLRWPAMYDYQDIQAWKGLWIGASNFKDSKGRTWNAKVVHIGPRVTGANEFYPVKFYTKSKFAKPSIVVDDQASEREANAIQIDSVDPNMAWDREIYTECNTQLGLTMVRRIFQFSNPNHENYIVNEYTFTNTGKADPADPTKVTYPGQTLDGLRFFFQYRMASNRQTRNVIGNPTGWGKNTNCDARADGNKTNVLLPANWEKGVSGEDTLRCQFSWHGKFNEFADYDNIGGPIWKYASLSSLTAGDTVGRLGSANFAGILTVHVDKSGVDKSDDRNQPSTTTTFDSDDDLMRNNSADNEGQNISEYALMSKGHDKRHLEKMGETNLEAPSKNAYFGSGGMSFANGYGPFKLAFGESMKIVFVEAVDGMRRDSCISVGHAYKLGQISKEAKNREVMKSKNKLMYTFKRALDNYYSGWQNGKSLMPPRELIVTGLGDKIDVRWTLYNESDPDIKGFKVYRALSRFDSTYYLMATLPASARSYSDNTAPRGMSAYYYVVSVGAPVAKNDALMISGDSLVSHWNYSITADPTTLKRPPGSTLSQIRVVPNPYNVASADILHFGERKDRIYFYDIPGKCTIRIYTEYGELIKTIQHTNNTGDEPWDCNTSSNQIVVSGLYIAVVTDNTTGASRIVKFVVIR